MAERGILERLIIPVVLGVSAIGIAAFVIYKIIMGPLEAKKEELDTWIEEWTKEYRDYIQDGALTDEEQAALDMKQSQIERVSKEITAFGWTPEKIYGLVFAAGVTALGLYAGKTALDYFKTRATRGETKTVYGYIATMGSAINIDLAERGFPTVAAAAQTSLENWVNTYYVPAMQNQIGIYEASIPYLTGMELLWAQYMITALQFEISLGLSAIFAAAWLLIW